MTIHSANDLKTGRKYKSLLSESHAVYLSCRSPFTQEKFLVIIEDVEDDFYVGLKVTTDETMPIWTIGLELIPS